MDTRACIILLLLVAFSIIFTATSAHPNQIGVCIRNCAQCKKMYGPYFEGQLCADTCVKFKAKIIPDCDDANSIGPFITKMEDD